MKRLFEIESFRGRFLAFYLVLAVPIARLLVRSGYELWRPEVPVVFAAFAVPGLLLAWLSRRPGVFYALLLALIAGSSASLVQAQCLPAVRWRFALLSIALVVGALMALFRRHFALLMAIMLGGMLLTDIGQRLAAAGFERWTKRPAANGPPAKLVAGHVIYLIFDEHIGLAGFPKDIPECQEAEGLLRQVLTRNGFRIYPNAYSNYEASWDSIPSVLNDRLLKRQNEYRGKFLRDNLLFDAFVQRGYELCVYYSDFIELSSPRYSYRSAREYDANDLSAILAAPADWQLRARQILLRHYGSDWMLQRYIERTFSIRGGDGTGRIGPLALRHVWPRQILEDVRAAARPTVFLAHLLHPHYPYVYERTGNIRPARVWMERGILESRSRTDYVRQYRAYAEQAMFLARQLDWFLSELRDAGIMDASTIVLHGDHGSRLKILKQGDSTAGRLDLDPGLELQELLDRYSTLLAVRPPGTSPAVIDEMKGSVLHHLRRFWRPSAAVEPELDSVFVFDAQGEPHAIPILKYWR